MVVNARGRRELLELQVQLPTMKLADEKSGLRGAGIGVLSTWAKPAAGTRAASSTAAAMITRDVRMNLLRYSEVVPRWGKARNRRSARLGRLPGGAFWEARQGKRGRLLQ